MQMILFIVVGVAITLGFSKVKSFIQKNFLKGAVGIAKEKINTNSSIGNVVNKNGEETFQWSKFKKAFKLNSLVEWVKDFLSMFNLRKIIIFLTIFGVFYAYGVYKGKLNKPVQMEISRESEFTIDLPKGARGLLKPKNSQVFKVLDKRGKLIKIVSVGDIKELRKKLSPYGLVFEPHFSYGVAIVDKKAKQDVGIGVSWLKVYKWRISNWLSNNGIWLGTDYKLTDNFGVGIGIGKSWEWENLFGLRGRFDF